MTPLKYEKKLINHGVLYDIEVGTNCPCGGDAGHGGITHIILHLDGGSAGADIILDKRQIHNDKTDIEIKMYGDWECTALIEALHFAADSLEKQYGKNKG